MTDVVRSPGHGGFTWLASYPKSGNTWFRALMTAYDANLEEVDINRLGARHGAAEHLFESFMACDGSLLTEEETFIARRAIYLHLAGTESTSAPRKVHDANLPLAGGELLFPVEATAAVIHIVRHPFDVAVSYAYHMGLAPDFGACIDRMCDPDYRIGELANSQFPQVQSDWSSHTLSWLDMPCANRITLRYEDMLADTETSFARALRVMFPGVEPDPARLRQAVEATRFDKLKAQEAAASFRERPEKSEAFFRSGKAGSWQDHLTPAQCARLAEVLAPAMQRVGYNADGSVGPWAGSAGA